MTVAINAATKAATLNDNGKWLCVWFKQPVATQLLVGLLYAVYVMRQNLTYSATCAKYCDI